MEITSMRSIDNIIQQKVFSSQIQRAHINVLVTASFLENNTAQVLKPLNISPQQFNILRILKGRDPEPVSLKQVSERMIDQNSNASRLVDKLVEKGLVDRCSCVEDRRQIELRISTKGAVLLQEANRVVGELHARAKSFSDEDAIQLSALLDTFRDIYSK
jgi:DNA-binding MarR family transcriptional regulator